MFIQTLFQVIGMTNVITLVSTFQYVEPKSHYWFLVFVLSKRRSWFDKLTTNGSSVSSVRPELVEGRIVLPFEYSTKLDQSPAINACFFLRDHPFICLSLANASPRDSNSQEYAS